MNTFIHRHATALKHFLLKALLPVQGAFVAARDALPSKTALSSSHAAAGGVFCRDCSGARARGPKYGFQLLFLSALLMGAVGSAKAATNLSCGYYPGVQVIDGDTWVGDPTDIAQINIEGNCIIKNFPAPDGLGKGNATINFSLPQGVRADQLFLVFDNVYYNGGFACANIVQYIDVWWVNGSFYNASANCVPNMVPVDSIKKQVIGNQTTATTGVPFKYSLKLPVMMKYVGTTLTEDDPYWDDVVLKDVHIYDNLTPTGDPGAGDYATGVDLQYLGYTAYFTDAPNTPVTLQESHNGDRLHFYIAQIPANKQLVIEIEVVLRDNPTVNAPGVSFYNTASWTLTKDYNGVDRELPGQNGVSEPLTITGPSLVVDKSSTVTNLNVNGFAPIKIDVHNAGLYASDAWNATIKDVLPSGMCLTSPLLSLTAQIFAADGVTPASGVLSSLTDYTATYGGCTLELTLKDTVKIGPGQHLVIKYNTQFDSGTTPSGAFTNVAGATDWYSDVSTNTRRTHYGPYSLTLPPALNPGTVGTADFQDAHTINAAVVGYYLLKSVENRTTGTTPATNTVLAAYPGNQLRYTLQIQNFTLPAFNDLSIRDDLPALIVPGSLTLISSTLPAGANLAWSSTGGANGTGFITITNLDLPSDTALTGIVYEVQFDVIVETPAATPALLSNQAQLLDGWDAALGEAYRWTGLSDDPFIGGPARLGDATATFHPTNATIYAPPPAPPTKALVSPVPTAAEATIGQEVVYQIVVPGTPSIGALHDVQVTDVLDAKLEYVGATVTGGVVGLTNTSTATQMNIRIDQIPAGQQAVIELRARVRNVGTAQQGVDINNTASYTYAYAQGGVPQPALSSAEVVTVNIVEPHISTITKTPSKAAPTAGETIRYSVTLGTSGGIDSSDVFDVTLTDTLAAGLEYVGNPSVTVGTGVAANNTIGDPVITGAGTTVEPYKLVWSLANGDDIDITEGTTVTVSYDVRVQNSVLAGTALANTVVAQWTGIDGVPVAPAYERDGSDGIGGLNDYITAPVTATVTTPNINATIAKTRISDTFGAGDANVRIGDIVEYEFRVAMPEGTLGNLQLADTLPQGLQFEGIVSVNGNATAPYVAVPPFSHADVAAPSVTGDAATGPTTVTWTLGAVTNQPADGASNDFVIVYRARVLNNVFAHSTLGIPLNNTVNMSYDTATGTVTHTDSEAITALQPMLSVTKSSNPVSGSSVAGGDIVIYTVDIKNDGNAPAYDVMLQDIVPDGMRTGGVTPWTATLVSGTAVTAPVPGYNATTGIATWSLDSGSIPAGDTLRVVYQVAVDAGVSQGATLTNQAQVQAYFSYDDGTPPVAGVTDTREAYGPSNTASTTLYTGAQVTKTLVSPTTAEATIGQEVVYQIKMPATLSTSDLYDVTVTDAADPNLEFISASVTGTLVDPKVTTTSTGMTVDIAQIPAGQQAVIELRARVRNVGTAQQGVHIANAASYTFAYMSGGPKTAPAQTGAVMLNIVEPHISTIAKAPSIPTPSAGQTVRYSVTLTAASGLDYSNVFDVTLTDRLDKGLVYVGNPSVTLTGVADNNTIGAPSITGDGVNTPQTLVWSLGAGNADIDIAEGASVTISYDVRVDTSVLAGTTLTNNVEAQWTSIDGMPVAPAYERNGTDGIGGLNDYVTATSAQVTTPGIDALITKTRIDDTYVQGDANVRVGDIVEYELRLSVPEGTLGNLELVDTLPKGLQYEGIVSINGDTADAYTAATPFAHADIPATNITASGNPATGPSTVTWNLGNVTNLPGDGLNNDFIIVYRARVLNGDVLTQVASTPLNNTVVMSYATATGTKTASDTDTVINVQQPILTVTKNSNPVSGSTIGSGQTVTYTVEIENTGAAPAYDVVLRDVIPANMQGGFTVENIYLASNVLPAPGLAVAPTTYTGGVATWNFDSSTYKIPANDRLVVVYSVQADGNIPAGLTLTNQATVDLYYSFDDQDAPLLGGIAGQREEYGPTTTASTTLYTGAPPTKTVSTTEATIGQEVVYTITVPATASTRYDVQITDPLDANLELVGTPTVTGVTPGVVTNSSTVTQMNISITEIPAGSQVVIELHARVRNVTGAQQGVDISNTASYTYRNVAGGTVQPALSSGTVTINIVEPAVDVQKAVTPLTPPKVDDILSYTLTLTASGGAANDDFSNAYDVSIVDTLSPGLAYVNNSAMVAGTPINPAIAIDPVTKQQTLTWNTGLDIIEGASPAPTVTYEVRVLPGVGAGQDLTNNVRVEWTSLNTAIDGERTGSGSPTENDYFDTAATTLTTPMPGVLSKQNPAQLTAVIGQPFTYTISVPEVAATTALFDVQIKDTLPAGVNFVSATVNKVAADNSQTPVNVVSSTNAGVLTIQGSGSGIDVAAGERLVVALTMVLANDTTTNYSGRTFTNTATYTYNQVNDVGPTVTTANVTTDPAMTVIGPDTMVMDKTGPTSMRVGIPETFTLDVTNTGTADAWSLTVTDKLPNPVPGGMCDNTPPAVQSVEIFDPATNNNALLASGQYSVAFTPGTVDYQGAPTCDLKITLLGSTVLPAKQRLIVKYQAKLDSDSINGTNLINVAGATQWSGGTGTGYHTYLGVLTDGTTGTADEQDAQTVAVESAILQIQKRVDKAAASPGETLRYTIRIENSNDVPMSGFTLIDELDALNNPPMFQAGTLTLVQGASILPSSAVVNVNPTGGARGTGSIQVSNLNVLANTDPNYQPLIVVFDATLAPVIASGSQVLNQGQLTLAGTVFGMTDDPAITGTQDPTRTVITSAPQFQILKTSQDLTGDTNVLMAGDTLRYTFAVKNIGTENATGVSMSDLIPAYTTYVANTTRLNGVPVADPSAGVSALNAGMLINAPEDTTPGAMRADASATTANVATVSFDVVINGDVLDGTHIANQGFVSGTGTGSGPLVNQPSDDPATPVLDDPTRDIVGNLPLLDATKTVALIDKATTPDVVDPGDVLQYTITVNNFGAIPATDVVLTDAIPTGTTYVAGTVKLNSGAVADPAAGISALEGGLQVGPIAAGASVTVTFDVEVKNDGTVNTGDVISNQGYVASPGLATEPTDADGNDANGDQPTTVVVGSDQQLLITKEVFVVGGGIAQAGGQLEYVVRVTNNGFVAATGVLITDDLTPLAGASYVAGSATLNGSTAGVNYAASVLTADYAATYGNLPKGASATLRFRVQVDAGLPIGTTLTNKGQVAWNSTLTAESSVSIDIGGIPGSAILNGHAWHDANFDNLHDSGETNLAGWTVELYRNNVQLGSVTTDAGGLYRFSGLAPSATDADKYELRFSAPGATSTTAKLGLADSVFTNAMQRISAIEATSGSNLQNLNLPIDPNGVVFDSITRAPIAGAMLTLVRAGSTTALPGTCFDDPAQQNQVTLATGFYKFSLNYGDASCPAGGDYVINVTPPPSGYVAGPSKVIPPVTSDATAAYDVASCAGDAVADPAGYCEAQVSAYAPAASVPASQINHYLHLTLSNPQPGHSQLFNNSIAIDPPLDSAVTISKRSALVNVSRGQLVPYTITVKNALALDELSIVDTFPPGFKYVAGSARVNGLAVEPVMTTRNLTWTNLRLDSNEQTIKLLFIVGSGVSEGDYVNRAQVFHSRLGSVSAEATATVRVVPDPNFDCTDVIGKVFDDVNRNGYQDAGEKGLPGVRVVSARGLLITTDDHGRFHVTCAVVPDENRGSNFILKVDDRTLPTGYRITTENPRVQRATRGKMMKFNFGAAINKIVRIDIANGVFEPDTTEMRMQWKTRMDLLLGELKKAPSILRLAYMAEVEDEKLVEARLKAMKQEIEGLWAQQAGAYELVIETEVFWRLGAPPSRSKLK